MGKEAAVRRVVVKADFRARGAEDHIGADQDESHDGHDLDHGETVLDLTEGLDAGRIHGHQRCRKNAYPDPARYFGKPVAHVQAHGRDFHAHGQHHGRPVGIAHEKAGPGRDVVFGIGAKRARGRVGHGHLGQAAHQQQRDQRADRVAQQHAGPGKADRKRAAHEQARADGAANRDHHDLRAAQMLLQAGFALLYVFKGGHGRVSFCARGGREKVNGARETHFDGLSANGLTRSS
ncbi:hypothetical protein D3C71_1457110 [compost metagenome]